MEGFYVELVGDLQEEIAELRTQLERTTAQETVEQVRARLIEPYVKAVFCFVTAYCGFVGIVLLIAGWKAGGFDLSDAILGVIAGSTAVSVIGLIGLVITGLFGSVPSPAKAAASRTKKPTA
jgi:succinate dehydrogenase/fumarate reductase cytochrome b subunit